MPLRPRVARFGIAPETRSSKADGRGGKSAAERDSINALKLKLHRQLIEHLDIAALEQLGDEAKIADEIRSAVIELLQQDSIPLSRAEREDVIEGILYEVTGLGPIEPLFRDPSSPANVKSPRSG